MGAASNTRRRGRAAWLTMLLPVAVAVYWLAGCAGEQVYHDPNMDFGAVKTVAVMPFSNLTRDNLAGERVRDVFSTALLASGGFYVVPAGEVGRGISRAGIATPTTPSPEDVVKLAKMIGADAVITGVVKEYGETRSGTVTANIISVSAEMIEGQTGRIVWSASSTKGGVGFTDRLFGGGGEPMNVVTEEAVNDLLDKLFL
ncbi:lipoprotein [Geotalea uraniireducens]|uniref:Lipoprotein n=1 Tax=Geotalea uraniireducens TaxID=351604 RepID=A0ABM8EK34_9BACT|nr:GNA1162 family protein [Geotalea uraniireducens]BDV42817.1 lipoprotein [Geotalea uraniireducens]